MNYKVKFFIQETKAVLKSTAAIMTFILVLMAIGAVLVVGVMKLATWAGFSPEVVDAIYYVCGSGMGLAIGTFVVYMIISSQRCV